VEVRNEYLTYCRVRCKKRDCQDCHLREFMEAYLQSMGSSEEAEEARSTIFGGGAAEGGPGAGGVESKIEDLIKETKGGDILEGVQLSGRRVVIRFTGSPLLKAVGIAISAAIRIFANFPIIAEMDLAIGDLQMVAQRSRAVDLVGDQGLDNIARDSRAFWHYFKPMVSDDRFAEKVFKYLGGEDNDAPSLVHTAYIESQQAADF
jgi:hypothetical protein